VKNDHGFEPVKAGPETRSANHHAPQRIAQTAREWRLGHIDTVAGRAHRGEGTIGRLSKGRNASINEVQGVAEGVNDTWATSRGSRPVWAFENDYNFLANTIKSYVQVRLHRAKDKYYVIELVNDPRGKTTINPDRRRHDNPNDPRTTARSRPRRPTLPLHLAIRAETRPVHGRFGIKESTGGVGIECAPSARSLRANAGPFRLRRRDSAALPRYVGYEFIPPTLGSLGFRRIDTYFAGIVATTSSLAAPLHDDDLKDHLPFAGSGLTSR